MNLGEKLGTDIFSNLGVDNVLVGPEGINVCALIPLPLPTPTKGKDDDDDDDERLELVAEAGIIVSNRLLNCLVVLLFLFLGQARKINIRSIKLY